MLEKLLLNLDVGVGGAILRVALGAILVFVLGLFPGVSSVAAAGSLAFLLFGVKLVTAVARRLVPASAAVRSGWEWRRSLARHYDSYQWRKLLWYGSGILVMAGVTDTRAAWEATLGAACVLSGAIAELLWRRKGLTSVPSVRG